jgi:hypothetical protein
VYNETISTILRLQKRYKYASGCECLLPIKCYLATVIYMVDYSIEPMIYRAKELASKQRNDDEENEFEDILYELSQKLSYRKIAKKIGYYSHTQIGNFIKRRQERKNRRY